MLDAALRLVQTVVGKTVIGLLGVFALGIVAMYLTPKFFVTSEALAQQVKDIRSEITQTRKDHERRTSVQSLEMIRFRVDYLKQQRFSLLETKEAKKRLTELQAQRLSEIDRELAKLEVRQDELEAELKK